MKKFFTLSLLAAVLFGLVSVTTTNFTAAQKGVADFDVQHYKIDAQLTPDQQQLRARVEVKFIPNTDTRSVVFEMNGSLTVRKVTRLDAPVVVAPVTTPAPPPLVRKPVANAAKPAAAKATPAANAKATPTPAPGDLPFIQDQKEKMEVRVDLGSVVPSKQPVTLAFEYDGALETSQGGPIQNARLAYVGESGSYLMYAARWFPFHEYAADRATYEIKVTVPKGYVVAGYSEQPVVEAEVLPDAIKPALKTTTTIPTMATLEASAAPKPATPMVSFTLVCAKPVLPGSLVAGKYIVKNIKQSGFNIDMYVKAGDEKWADAAAKTIGEHLEFYSAKFGAYPFGNRLIVAQTDDETLETYSAPGMIFLSPRALQSASAERLGREVAFQWWGQAVGIQSFDDIFISQGLAEFSMLLALRDSTNEAQFQDAIQSQLEKALAFEQSSSIRNAPKQLDDQTPAYRSVVFNKGALVMYMLRQLMGEKEFDAFLRNYYKQNSGKNLTLDEFEAQVTKAAGRNMRFFFGQWVDSTGVPEFRSEYRILRTKDGFRVPGTVKQEMDTFEMPVDIILKTEAGNEKQTVLLKGTSVDFDIVTKSKPSEVVVDPDYKIIKTSEELRQGVVVRRGIEHFREQEYTEAEQQFQAAIKLNRNNSWAWYNLGLLYITQRNHNKALDAFEQALNGNMRPEWIEVWSYIYRGNAWDSLGQRERAVADYNKALTNGGDYENAQATAQQYLAEPYGSKKTKASNDGQ